MGEIGTQTQQLGKPGLGPGADLVRQGPEAPVGESPTIPPTLLACDVGAEAWTVRRETGQEEA